MIEQVRSKWRIDGRASALRTCDLLLASDLTDTVRWGLLAWQIVLLLEMGYTTKAAELAQATPSEKVGDELGVAKACYEFFQGRMAAACSQVDSVLEHSCDWLSLYVGALCHAHLLENERVMGYIERWNTNYPDDPLVLRKSSDILRMLGHYSEADEYRSRLIRWKPVSVHAFISAAELAEEKGHFDKAMQEYREGVKRFGGDDELWSRGAFCLWRQGLHLEAVEWALQALRWNEHSFIAYSVLESWADATGKSSVAQRLHQVRQSLLAEQPPLFAPIVSILETVLDVGPRNPSRYTQGKRHTGSPLVQSLMQKAFTPKQRQAHREKILQDVMGEWSFDLPSPKQRDFLLKILVQAAQERETELKEFFMELLLSSLSPDFTTGIIEIISLLRAGLIDEARQLASAYAEIYPQVEEYHMLRQAFHWRWDE